MNAHTIALLEFDAVRQRVASCCRSEEGRSLLLAALPETRRESLERTRRLVVDLSARLWAEPPPAMSFPYVADLPARVAKPGFVLELDELYALGLFARSSAALRAWLAAAGLPSLAELAGAIPDMKEAERVAFRVVADDGTLRELPEIRDIKRRIQALNKDIAQTVQALTGSEGLRSMLQSELPTQRDGRIVLAVKANYKGRIKGIVHEMSATGQTVYIEPEDVFEKNNRIVEEEARLQLEVRRVLREATEALAPLSPQLLLLASEVAVADALLARAEFSVRSRGSFAAEGPVRLAAARHPLLGPQAVPVDILLGEGTRMLLVTGPNTGGKTVGLKTLALLALMNQFALALPVAEGSTLPWFDGVFADIGDEQSISQSLSTFSGHMRNIAAILAAATGRSLVVLDELGSGTDPEEGSAIAMAILDELIERGATVFVTTHHGILKSYGYTRPGVMNASVGFDPETLRPTYELLIGIPGESHAIDIASRNGLQPALVERSRSYLSEERADVSALIKGLKEKHDELGKLEEEQRERRQKLLAEQRETDLKELRLRQRERELKAQGLGSLERLLSESRKELENLVREVKEGELSREKTKRVKDFLDKLAGEAEAERRGLEEAERDERARIAAASARVDDGSSAELPFAPGAEVRFGPQGKAGTLVRRGKGSAWIVEAGALRLAVEEAEIRAAPPRKEERRASIELSLDSERNKPVFELDVRGMRLEEALDAVRRQLDAAALSGMGEFSIIHGKGEGILQQGIQQYLRNSPLVSGYSFARPELGGFGKTVVRLG